MNIDAIKKEFPIFDEKIQNNDLVNQYNSKSSKKPKVGFDVRTLVCFDAKFDKIKSKI